MLGSNIQSSRLAPDYVFGPGGGGGTPITPNIFRSVYSGTSLDLLLTNTQCVRFNPNGTRMFINDGPTLYQYDLSTPYNITTAIRDDVNTYVIFTGRTLGGFSWRSDGLRIFYVTITGSTTRSTWQIDVLNPYDLTGAADNGNGVMSGTPQNHKPGVANAPNDIRQYTVNSTSLAQYDLNEAGDVTPGGLGSVVSAQSNTTDIYLFVDGTHIYTSRQNLLYDWNMEADPYNLLGYSDGSVAILDDYPGTTITGLELTPDNNRMFLLDATGIIYEYTMLPDYPADTIYEGKLTAGTNGVFVGYNSGSVGAAEGIITPGPKINNTDAFERMYWHPSTNGFELGISPIDKGQGSIGLVEITGITDPNWNGGTKVLDPLAATYNGNISGVYSGWNWVPDGPSFVNGHEYELKISTP